MLGIAFRRLYSTGRPTSETGIAIRSATASAKASSGPKKVKVKRPSSAMPEAALVARTASTPIAVRARRGKKTGRVIKPGETDATFLGLTPSDHARYLRRKAQGLLSHRNGDESERKWHERQNKQRSRIRGMRTVTRDGKQEVEVVGQTIYLPNVIFRLVRNNTPPGEPYNPYEATFRIPLSITKTDIRSYLLAVYGVKTTYIRTDIYRPAVPGRGAPQTKTAYKRAVVGLVEPFYYPHRVEEMDEKAKEERTKRLEDAFQVAEGKETQKLMFLKLTRELSSNNKIKNPMAMTRAAILARVSERRKLRESTVENVVVDWWQKRAEGQPIQLEDLNKPISPPATPATPS
ncbi:uncharacterized protein ARMOST_06792 [Armillaria ostoyae]|uniref:Large ribosomal subunit protein uL23m n=1 Tax=Armillaria ostoyae TaxID=47428 RepID=A0A284R411_ARMOS|nr:uncharacterized protein ARMOST_06792 [Armillaria ostoyae]